MKAKRDPLEFQEAQQTLAALKQSDKRGAFDLFYFDESGFSLTPQIPYAWQRSGTPIELPTAKGKSLNVLGFLNRKNELFPYIFETNVNADMVVACFDAFAQHLKCATVVVIDNAPMHHSKTFIEHIPRWREKGLFLYYLPRYAPELNLIEILWRMIKYYWLPFSAYNDYETLSLSLEQVLIDFGTKHVINFS